MVNRLRSKQITDEILVKLSEIVLSELAKICYCFNSKGNNANVKKLQAAVICLPQETDTILSLVYHKRQTKYCHWFTTRDRQNIVIGLPQETDTILSLVYHKRPTKYCHLFTTRDRQNIVICLPQETDKILH